MTNSRNEAPAIRLLRPLLLAAALTGLFFISAMAEAEAACVETGFASYRKGGMNRGTYVGDPGDSCRTIIAGNGDPIVATAGGASDKRTTVGTLELYIDGWTYTFANTPPGRVETLILSAVHQSGIITSFTVTVTRR